MFLTVTAVLQWATVYMIVKHIQWRIAKSTSSLWVIIGKSFCHIHLESSCEFGQICIFSPEKVYISGSWCPQMCHLDENKNVNTPFSHANLSSKCQPTCWKEVGNRKWNLQCCFTGEKHPDISLDCPSHILDSFYAHEHRPGSFRLHIITLKGTFFKKEREYQNDDNKKKNQ